MKAGKARPSEVLKDCRLIKENVFNSERGVYNLSIWTDGTNIYLLKCRNGNMVEFNNLTEMAEKV